MHGPTPIRRRRPARTGRNDTIQLACLVPVLSTDTALAARPPLTWPPLVPLLCFDRRGIVDQRCGLKHAPAPSSYDNSRAGV